MKKKVGIRFKSAGKVYDFDCGAFVLKPGDQVIVETEQGLGLGIVVLPPLPFDEKQLKRPLKKVYRLASKKDFYQREKNGHTIRRAFDCCQKFIEELGLKMNLFSVESTFDAGKLTFFFTSEGRVDFRQLVKMLAEQLGRKIEMRQVGIRNKAKMCGGIGRCGRQICCSAFIEKFEPVSIRMAKEQNLSLNPSKISGQCGRLMCCLTFENTTYLELKKKFPKIGEHIKTQTNAGKVIRHNVICNQITVRTDEDLEVDIPLSEFTKE